MSVITEKLGAYFRKPFFLSKTEFVHGTPVILAPPLLLSYVKNIRSSIY
jgi:hypothetical protein